MLRMIIVPINALLANAPGAVPHAVADGEISRVAQLLAGVGAAIARALLAEVLSWLVRRLLQRVCVCKDSHRPPSGRASAPNEATRNELTERPD